MASAVNSAVFLQQPTRDRSFTKQIVKEVQTNLFCSNIIHNQVVASEPKVQECVWEEEPMEVEYTCSDRGAMNLSPIISLPEEIQ
jgi:hypothetical protein